MRYALAKVGIVTLVLQTGCATSKIDYTPPVEPKVQNAKQVGQPFDAVWDRLVKQLSSDFFVINNIDKNSRLINLSFTAQRPSEFVDCGNTSRTFTNARGDQSYSYRTADSATFVTTNDRGAAFNARRNTKLEGRTNIYVAPEGNGTLVTVNTKYVVSVNVRFINMDGNVAGEETRTFDFSTKQGHNDGQVSCYGVGAIERRILAFVD